jgi:16S rRNA processing protein RimM
MRLLVGRVSKPHGLRGEVIVEVHTDSPELRFAAGSVLATDPAAAGPLTVSRMHWHSSQLLVSFAAVTDRDRAAELRDTLLLVDSADLETTCDPDEFHDYQLVGLTVLTTRGESVGVVADIRHQGQDMLVIAGTGDRTGAEILVPFVAPLVPDVDVPAGRLVIDPPPGLLDLGAG